MRFLLGFLLAALSTAASAQQATGTAEFNDGMQLYRTHDCLGAVGPLDIASRLSPRPAALLALGYCYRQLKQFPEAIDAYQRYIQLHDDEKRATFLLEQTSQEEREWLRAQPQPPTLPVGPELPTMPPSFSSVVRARGWTSRGLLIGGTAAVVVGSVFAIQARSAGKDWQNAMTAPGWSDARSRAQSTVSIANAGFIAGGALLASGLSLFLFTDGF